MSDDLDENRSVGPAASAFPKTILVAGIMWIALGSLIFLLGGLGFAAGNAGPTVFWGLIFGIASIYVGVNSVRGLARNMLGNGIGSIVFAMLTLSLTVQTLVRVMDLRAPEDRGSLVVSMLFAGLTTLVAIGFLAAGILAFVGRGNYRTWRLAHKSSKSSTGWAQHRSGGDSSTRIV